MKTIEKILSWLSRLMLWLCCGAMLAMLFHVSADVLFKIALNQPIVGTLEVVSFIYMVACTFMPLPFVMQERSLIVVELLSEHLALKNVLRLEILGGLLTALYIGGIGFMAGVIAWDKTGILETQDATYFELPIWPMRWVLSVACSLAAIVVLFRTIDDIRLAITGARSDGSTEMQFGNLHV